MNRILVIATIFVTGLLFGSAFHNVWQGTHDDAKVIAWDPDVRWIGAPESGYQAYFRHTFYMESQPSAAWLRLSADSSFDLYVNGQRVSRESSPTNHTKGVGDGLSSHIKQPANDARAYRAPIEYVMSLWSAPDWKLCVYEDIAKYLTPGRNVIAIAVQHTLPNPRLAVEGGIELSPERKIDIATGRGAWKASSRAENDGDHIWFDPEFPDSYWDSAIELKPVDEAIYSRLSRAAMATPPRGLWIGGPESPTGEVWLRGEWYLPDLKDRAILRCSANASADIMVNGQLIGDPLRMRASTGRLNIYNVRRLVQPGKNYLAMRLIRPLAEQQPAIGGLPMQLFIDGWQEDGQGDISSPLASGNGWTAFASPADHWYLGSGEGKPALVLGALGLKNLSRAYCGDAADYHYLTSIRDFGLALLAGFCCIGAVVWGIRRLWLPSDWEGQRKWNATAALLLPGTVAMFSLALLTHRYSETDIAFYLTSSRASLIMLVAFAVTTGLFLVGHWHAAARSHQAWASGKRLAFLCAFTALTAGIAASDRGVLFAALAALAAGTLAILIAPDGLMSRIRKLAENVISRNLVTAIALAAIVMAGLALRTQYLPSPELSPDEFTSLDVVRGILRTGLPEATSGIWYTRSPAYHYGTAAWLYLFGDTVHATQLLSVAWGTGLIVVAFFMTKLLTRRNDLSLLVALFFALDRWLIILSRGIRFYVVIEFLTLLFFYFFFKGFVERGRSAYRVGFFVTFALAILHQEVMITLFPIFFLGLLMLYRPFRLRDDWPWIAATGLVLAVFIIDVLVYEYLCLTSTIALNSKTDSIAKPHLKYVTRFFNGFFMGSSRIHVVFSFFFFVGLIQDLVRRNWHRVFLSAAVLMYLAELTVLVRQISVRYTCPVYPIFLILAITAAFQLANSLADSFGKWISPPLALRFGLTTIMLGTLLLGDEYWRMIHREDERVVKATWEVTRYIREHARETDVVMSPSAPVAAVELGGLDYYLAANQIQFDVPYRKGNYIRDRWGGGILVSNPEAFARVFENADRVWLYYDEVNESKLSPAMRHHMRTTGRTVLESYAATLRLWERNQDPVPIMPREGRDLGAY